jgi:uncharacterized protein YndB with AHSA1/START domain
LPILSNRTAVKPLRIGCKLIVVWRDFVAIYHLTKITAAMKTIEKSIDINAPVEEVWHVLLDDESTRSWLSEFSEGSHVETDWKVGSRVVYSDNSGKGIAGTVVINKPNEVLSIEYDEYISNEKEHDSDEEDVKGFHETYTLTDNNGVTLLEIESEMADKYIDQMSKLWENALRNIKSLAEGNAKLAAIDKEEHLHA